MGTVHDLKNRLLGKGKADERVIWGALFDEFSCVDAVMGVDYEVLDGGGKVVFTIRRKPISIEQMSELSAILHAYKTAQQKETRRRR